MSTSKRDWENKLLYTAHGIQCSHCKERDVFMCTLKERCPWYTVEWGKEKQNTKEQNTQFQNNFGKQILTQE